MKKLFFYSLFFLGLQACSNGETYSQTNIEESALFQFSMPFASNVWVVGDQQATETLVDVRKAKLKEWKDPKHKLAFYFYSGTSGDINLSLTGSFPKDGGLSISFANQKKEVSFTDSKNGKLAIGEFTLSQPGYHQLIFTKSSLLDENSVNITTVNVTSNDVSELNFITDKEVYFARRGPSAHLKYQLPDTETKWQWLYSEIDVPKDQDPVGSYFMANGFAQGYFGMQVNSPTERRILFSVWSPFKTQDPKNVPPEQQIKLIRKGDNVHTGKFGNEGVGGQSYKKFNWQAGNRYKFLLKVTPIENNHTEYTAYFYASEVKQWQLIASFQRPKTSSYVERPHAFIENFITSQGDKVRKANYSNQWVADPDGNWHKIKQANVTFDNTARNKYRFDYQGGSDGSGGAYLKNGGFFNDPTPYNKPIKLKTTSSAPKINFDLLP